MVVVSALLGHSRQLNSDCKMAVERQLHEFVVHKGTLALTVHILPQETELNNKNISNIMRAQIFRNKF